MNRVHRIGSESTSKLLIEFSLPAIVAMLVQSTYSIIDRIFIGNGAGTAAISGITLCLPVIAIFMAFGMLIGIGGASLYSLCLGEGENSGYRKIPGNTFTLLLIISLFLSLVTSLSLNEILIFFGAKGESLIYASQYLKILLIGLPLQTVGYGMNNFIRAKGRPGMAMATMLIGSISNIILAPLFIFTLHMGIKGAAVSTVSAQLISCLWVLSFFRSGKSIIKPGSPILILSIKTSMKTAVMGLGPFIMQIGTCVVAAVYNHQLMIYGNGPAVAVYGIMHCIMVFLLMPVLGISQGAQPLIGYNYGAGRILRVRGLLFKSVTASAFILLCGFIIVFSSPGFFISIFNPADMELRSAGIHALNIFISMVPLAALQICASGYFLAAGKPKQAVLLTVSRQIIFLLPMIMILPRFYGVDGIWMAAPVSDMAAFLLTLFILFRELQELKKKNLLFHQIERA